MDDTLEVPTSNQSNLPLGDLPAEQAEDAPSDEEDGGLDWTKLLPAAMRPVIPKRGEKEYEPRGQGGTNLQLHVLDRSRSAMYQTLRAQRTISSKAVSYGVWVPGLSRTHITLARGIHFSNMGHSAPRLMVNEDGVEKMQKRLELLPEEAIYLIERGALYCWKHLDTNFATVPGLADLGGAPMTVQQAYAEMIGHEGLTLEKFQVYAYLRRLGYIVTRAEAPSDDYPLPPPYTPTKPSPASSPSILQRLGSFLPNWIASAFNLFTWWTPVRLSRWLHHDKNYGSLFRSLRLIPAGHKTPLRLQQPTAPSPYQIFYNVYKPATPFKKSAPPPPDFQIVVVNARTTFMPTIQELTNLFDALPETPVPPPRQRRQPGTPGALAASKPNQGSTSSPSQLARDAPAATPCQASFLHRLFPFWFSASSTTSTSQPKRPNPFAALKHGKKIIIVAAVDQGNTSFFRFAQGEFSEWPIT